MFLPAFGPGTVLIIDFSPMLFANFSYDSSHAGFCEELKLATYHSLRMMTFKRGTQTLRKMTNPSN